jgi:thymidylate synthase
MADYLAKEEAMYLTGERQAEIWAEQASKFWSKLANPDGTINSNYGWLMFQNRSLPNDLTPWEWAVDSLRKDRNSRQAFVRLSLPEHQAEGIKDQPCTLYAIYHIRDNLLHATTVMRSNDVVKGLAYDMPWFCKCQGMMAREVGVKVGTYTHFANSMHLYERDIDAARKMLGLGELIGDQE